MTTKKKILQDIREFCLLCCGGSYAEVAKCTSIIERCPIKPYRFGRDPNPSAAKVEIGKALTRSHKKADDQKQTKQSIWEDFADDPGEG